MLINEVRAEPARHVEVHLQGAALPIAADGIAEDELELRAVEGALSWIERVLDPGGPGGCNQCPLGVVPDLIATYALGGPVRKFDAQVVKAEVPVDVQYQLGDRDAFGADLVFCNKDVSVVLGECADPHQSVQSARRLITVHLAE